VRVALPQRRVLTTFAQLRPHDMVPMSRLRFMPLAPDGGINPKMFGVGPALNLQPRQFQTIDAGWQRYKERTSTARKAGREALHCAVKGLHNSMTTGFSGEVSPRRARARA